MKPTGIEDLLEKYFEGNTTLSEEQSIRDFFREPDVPQHLLKYESLFKFFESEQKIKAPFRQLTGMVPGMPEQNTFQSVKSGIHTNNRFYILSGLAASLIILISMTFLFRNDIFRKGHTLTLTPDQELAYTETRQTLLFISGSLNTGLRQIETLQKVDQAFAKVQMLNKFFQYQPVNINPDEINDQSIKSR
ncbi:MAG: hypothetical protein PHP04_06250 [Bacteroidales bacterium]|nr:hypothetical protein [Bacteroidales bacterium]HNW73609.1 hypothetical protein [Bacteroidales bacterium]HPS50180.1 hypothetical protein [Bacteroidales bacterium]